MKQTQSFHPALRLWMAVGTLLLLASCATLERSPETTAQPNASTQVRALNHWLAQLEGDFESARQWQPDNPDGHGASITRLQFDRHDASTVRMTQRTGSGPTRAFLWVFDSPKTDGLETTTSGQFITLGERGQRLGQCQLQVTALASGLVIETIPAQCQFDTAQGQVRLLKELAFDGQSVVIADQLLDPANNDQPLGPASVLQSWRSVRFKGWAGRMDGADQAWRIARPISVDSREEGIEPLDAAGMDLGISVQLDYYQPRDRATPLLRLRVDIENAYGEISTHQAWADRDATEIGLSLPAVQVGLSR